MKPPDHGRWLGLLGAYALGHLPQDLSAALEAHLDGCPTCRDELAELRDVARALPLADPARVEGRLEEPPPEVETAILRHVAVERGADRRRGAVWIAAAAVLLVVAVVGVASVLGGQDETRVTLAGEAPGSAAEARVEPRPWGTQVELAISGLPGDATYFVWLERPDGERVPAGTFRGVPDRELTVVLASALPFVDAVAVGVSTEDGTTLLEGRLPQAA